MNLAQAVHALVAMIDYDRSNSQIICDFQIVLGVANDQGDMLSAFGSRDVLVSGKGNDILIDRTTDKQTIFQFDASSGHDAVYGFTAAGAQSCDLH